MSRRILLGVLLALSVIYLGLQAGPLRPAANAYTQLASLIFTTGSAGADETLPLLIVMHGLGDTPEHFASLFRDLGAKARVAAVRAPDPYGDGFSWYPIDDPQRRSAAIERSAARVVALAKELAAEHKTRGLPIVTGFSQGGVLSFAVAALYPSSIRAAFPIAGLLDDRLAIKKAPKLPTVHAFHGTDDARIPLAGGEKGVKRLQEAGFSARLTRLQGLGHSISPALRAALFDALRAALSRSN
jgi:phospholipase/carboxylesterase